MFFYCYLDSALFLFHSTSSSYDTRASKADETLLIARATVCAAVSTAPTPTTKKRLRVAGAELTLTTDILLRVIIAWLFLAEHLFVALEQHKMDDFVK